MSKRLRRKVPRVKKKPKLKVIKPEPPPEPADPPEGWAFPRADNQEILRAIQEKISQAAVLDNEISVLLYEMDLYPSIATATSVAAKAVDRAITSVKVVSAMVGIAEKSYVYPKNEKQALGLLAAAFVSFMNGLYKYALILDGAVMRAASLGEITSPKTIEEHNSEVGESKGESKEEGEAEARAGEGSQGNTAPASSVQ